MREAAGPALRPLSPFPVPFPMTDGVVLAFDFGVRRIGVAIGNSVTHEARPLATVAAAGSVGPWAAIGKLIDDWQPARLVVGVPLHPDGTPHEMTARCERFARQLEGRFRLPVERVDERYSSAAATGAVDVDAAAAALILQQWFDESEAKGRNA
jgi:putative holliday junction resolvase